MTLEQMLTITKLLNQIEPVLISDDAAGNDNLLTLHLGDEKEIVVYPNGTQLWYLHGRLHREDGPAVINPNGTRHWYLDGEQKYQEEHAAEMKKRLKRPTHSGGQHVMVA